MRKPVYCTARHPKTRGQPLDLPWQFLHTSTSYHPSRPTMEEVGWASPNLVGLGSSHAGLLDSPSTHMRNSQTIVDKVTRARCYQPRFAPPPSPFLPHVMLVEPVVQQAGCGALIEVGAGHGVIRCGSCSISVRKFEPRAEVVQRARGSKCASRPFGRKTTSRWIRYWSIEAYIALKSLIAHCNREWTNIFYIDGFCQHA